MAVSQPVPSAQLGCIVKCELCDSAEDVNSFCNNCLQNICDNCKKLHQKIPSLRSHDIGSIGDGRRMYQGKEQLCVEHGEILNYCCKTCSINVCPKCLSGHLKHELLDINEEGHRLKEELQEVIESKSKLLERIRDSRATMLQHKTKFDSEEEDVISIINGEFEMILNLKIKLTETVKERNSDERKKLLKQIEILQDFESKIDGEIQRIKEDLPLHYGSGLVKFAKKEFEMLKAIETPPSSIELPNPMKLSSQTLSKCIDSTREVTRIVSSRITQIKAEQILSIDINILSTFNVQPTSINDIVFDEKDKTWVTWIGLKEMKQIDNNGITHKAVQMIPDPVYLAKGENANVYITTGRAIPVEQKIRKFCPLENVCIFVDLSKFENLYDLAFDGHGVLFCHARLKSKDFIVKIDGKGEIIWKTELGSHSFFRSSVTFSPQNICYIALKSKIYIISTEGQVLKRKDWDSSLGELGPILFDNNGLLLAGTDNGNVHILNENVEVIKSYECDTLKGSKIKAFACDNDHRVWIGNDTGQIFIATYTNLCT